MGKKAILCVDDEEIILITGQADDAFIERVQKNGIASNILLKPWTTRRLLQAVGSCFDDLE